jgi:hypothetical protein
MSWQDQITPRRQRRGVEAIEFAMILPIFIVILFSVFEFSYYIYQRGTAIDAARRGCHAAARLDPNVDDFAAQVDLRVTDVFSNSHLDCDDAAIDCQVALTLLLDSTPPRIICDVTATHRTLTGLFTQADRVGSMNNVKMGLSRWSGLAVLPSNLRGRSVAVFEGVAE